ncbi:MAG: cytochrome c biogenesis CcdA family protein [Dehalococcoidia bacterium]
MSVSEAAAGKRRDPRVFVYAGLALLVAAPAAVFVVLGVDATGFRLEGAAGPLLAFSAGVLSFLSPCVLPLVPIYITHLAGTGAAGGAVIAERRKTFSHAVAFILGLSAVFVTLGASVGLAGFFVQDHLRELEQGAGALMIFLGALLVPINGRLSPVRSAVLLLGLILAVVVLDSLAHLSESPVRLGLLLAGLGLLWARASGYVELNVFARTVQFNVGTGQSVGYARSALVGGAFATGWTPCVGPILGGILTLAATSGEAWTGAYLLLFYSAGFSIPFLITGLAVADVSRAMKSVQKHFVLLELASAVMMVGLGTLLLAGRLTALNEYFSFADFNQGL